MNFKISLDPAMLGLISLVCYSLGWRLPSGLLVFLMVLLSVVGLVMVLGTKLSWKKVSVSCVLDWLGIAAMVYFGWKSGWYKSAAAVTLLSAVHILLMLRNTLRKVSAAPVPLGTVAE